jgi:hypothetical protein
LIEASVCHARVLSAVGEFGLPYGSQGILGVGTSLVVLFSEYPYGVLGGLDPSMDPRQTDIILRGLHLGFMYTKCHAGMTKIEVITQKSCYSFDPYCTSNILDRS